MATRLTPSQRDFIHILLKWVDGIGDIYIHKDRMRDEGFIKDQLNKVLLLGGYDSKDKELLNDLRRLWIDGYKQTKL